MTGDGWSKTVVSYAYEGFSFGIGKALNAVHYPPVGTVYCALQALRTGLSSFSKVLSLFRFFASSRLLFECNRGPRLWFRLEMKS